MSASAIWRTIYSRGVSTTNAAAFNQQHGTHGHFGLRQRCRGANRDRMRLAFAVRQYECLCRQHARLFAIADAKCQLLQELGLGPHDQVRDCWQRCRRRLEGVGDGVATQPWPVFDATVAIIAAAAAEWADDDPALVAYADRASSCIPRIEGLSELSPWLSVVPHVSGRSCSGDGLPMPVRVRGVSWLLRRSLHSLLPSTGAASLRSLLLQRLTGSRPDEDAAGGHIATASDSLPLLQVLRSFADALELWGVAGSAACDVASLRREAADETLRPPLAPVDVDVAAALVQHWEAVVRVPFEDAKLQGDDATVAAVWELAATLVNRVGRAVLERSIERPQQPAGAPDFQMQIVAAFVRRWHAEVVEGTLAFLEREPSTSGDGVVAVRRNLGVALAAMSLLKNIPWENAADALDLANEPWSVMLARALLPAVGCAEELRADDLAAVYLGLSRCATSASITGIDLTDSLFGLNHVVASRLARRDPTNNRPGSTDSFYRLRSSSTESDWGAVAAAFEPDADVPADAGGFGDVVDAERMLVRGRHLTDILTSLGILGMRDAPFMSATLDRLTTDWGMARCGDELTPRQASSIAFAFHKLGTPSQTQTIVQLFIDARLLPAGSG